MLCCLLPCPSPSNTALSSLFGDNSCESVELWDEESLFKYVDWKQRNRNTRHTIFTASFCITMPQIKMIKSEFKFIITFKEAAYEENWNYFSKIKTQQDIETGRGGSKQRSQGLFCWLEKNSCHWMDCTSVRRKAFPVCISFSTWNPAEV